MQRKQYTAPKLVAYGAVSDLTRGGNMTNQDVPFGNAPNTAYPPPS